MKINGRSSRFSEEVHAIFLMCSCYFCIRRRFVMDRDKIFVPSGFCNIQIFGTM